MDMKIDRVCLVFVTIGLVLGAGMLSAVGGPTSGKDLVQGTGVKSLDRRVIMVTGFWNPTGQMLVPFSTDPELNPGGWQGENWEGLGYDIYSFFPKPGVYTGMFEVDYQDTWNDFWNVTGELHPFAIISFGAGAGPWEIEYNARNLDSWINDDTPPYQPTPCPPDDTQPAGYVRHSSLPVQAIADEVSNQTGLNAWVDWAGNPGMYLCEFIAYLGMWYHDTHNVSGDPYPCRAAGFIHVNAGVAVNVAMNATKVTIRETIAYLSDINRPPADPSLAGPEEGDIGETYSYTVVTSDDDDDMVMYYLDWGDGTNSGWLGFYEPGQDVTASHVWEKGGTYLVKVKAQDEYGAESGWRTLEVTITGDSTLEITISGGFGVKAAIKNTGTSDLTDVAWSIALDGKLIFVGKSQTGTIDALAVGESVTVKDFVIGFGKTGIAVEAGGVAASAQGTALLFFVLGVA